jgi:hypothetical protein
MDYLSITHGLLLLRLTCSAVLPSQLGPFLCSIASARRSASPMLTRSPRQCFERFRTVPPPIFH